MLLQHLHWILLLFNFILLALKKLIVLSILTLFFKTQKDFFSQSLCACALSLQEIDSLKLGVQ